MKNTYSEPKLFPRDRNIKKLWFVAFRFTDPSTGDRKQFQFRGDINNHKSKGDRIIEGTSLCSALFVMLKEGWNPFTVETEKEYDRKMTLHDLLDNIFLNKKSILKVKSYRTYSDAKNILQRWMIKKKTFLSYAFISFYRQIYTQA